MKNILLFIVFSPFVFYSQKQGNIWYFGDHAGLSFNTGTPVAITNGQTYLQAGHTEGTSVISDSSGALLFYSNGEKIWNKNHLMMPQGDSINGSFSATQSSLIIPLPNSTRFFYLFTNDDFNHNLQFGLRYSVIDMCLEDGLGDVIPFQKNILLLDTAGEKLIGVRHANGTDYWIVVHKYFSDAFYAYLFTSTGITGPVISHIGSVHTTSTGSVAGSIGYMKASPSGNRLALVSDNGGQLRELFDFNKTTGIVSNFINLHLPSDLNQGAYGVSFSSDNVKLYISTNIKITQYDLNAGSGNADSIRNSKIIINSASSSNNYGLQLGPDGKIYATEYGTPYLSVINNPNNQGLTCNFISNAVSLSGKNCNFGLPDFIDSYDYSNSLISCSTEVQETAIEFPNVFTPNGDGLNDDFIPLKYKGITKAILKIYNRWGEELFFTDSLIKGWNGYYKSKMCSEGTYFWIAEYATDLNKSNKLRGFFTLLK